MNTAVSSENDMWNKLRDLALPAVVYDVAKEQLESTNRRWQQLEEWASQYGIGGLQLVKQAAQASIDMGGDSPTILGAVDVVRKKDKQIRAFCTARNEKELFMVFSEVPTVYGAAEYWDNATLIWLLNKEGEILQMNEAATELIVGVTVQLPFPVLFSHATGLTQSRGIHEHMQGNWHGEKLPVTLAGFNWSLQRMSIPQGWIVTGTRLSVELIKGLTEQKKRAYHTEEMNEVLKQELELHKRTQLKLERAQGYLQSVLDSSLNMVFSLDHQGIIMEYNRTARDTLHFPTDEVIGKEIQDFFTSPDEFEKIRNTIEHLGFYRDRSTMKHYPEGVVNVFVSGSKLTDSKGQKMGYVLSIRDITRELEADRLTKEQRAKMEAIFDSGAIMFWTVNRNIALTSFNREYANTIENLYGEAPQVNRDLDKPRKKFASDAYHEFWERKYREVFRTGESLYFQTKTTDKTGDTRYREVYLNPIWSDDLKTQVTEVAGMAVDITDKKRTERRLNDQANKIKTIFDATNHSVWSVDMNYNLTSFNISYEKRMLERYGIQANYGQNTIEVAMQIGIPYAEKLKSLYDRVKLGEKILIEVAGIDQNGKEYIDELSISPIYNEDEVLTEIACLAQTVTYKRSAEKKLKNQAAKITAIFESTALIIWTLDVRLRVVSYNKVFSDEFFRFSGKELGIGIDFSKSLSASLSDKGKEELKSRFARVLAGEKQQFEGAVYTRQGTKRWIEVFMNPIYGEQGEVIEISCMCYEITEKKQIEEQMKASIKEKEILLQEVHHRVKNNLQVISSILNLQSAYVRDENSLNILRESQNRIKSMSFIHEALYQTKDFSGIEFSGYILTITNNLIHSYSVRSSLVKLHTRFLPVFLSLDQAIPCGLIVNELISNALKYAFPEGHGGTVYLEIEEKQGQVRLLIGDDGIGLPEGFDWEKSESLGLQLVYTLIDQLDATIHVESSKGTKYLITFEKR
jgi:PAS domain S-box-containing protein